MSPNGSKNISVIAYNPAGVLLWKRRLQGTQHPYSLPLSITSDSQDNVYVSGYTADNTSSPREMLFAKLDANGNIKFINTSPASTSIIYANSSFTDNHGNSFVSTSGKDTLGYFTSILLKYDSSGNLLWQKLLSDSAYFTGMLYDGPEFHLLLS